MMNERDRVISISLKEAEWQAFVERQPRPVDWLREQILSEVGRASSTEPELAAGAASLADERDVTAV
jgi:hypothetical protein